jgi:hypothetical protein
MGRARAGQRRKRRMSKTPKRPKVRKLKRNPLAKALGLAKFRPRVVERTGVYKRRPRMAKETDNGEE